VNGQPLIAHTLAAFQECPAIDAVIVVVRQQDIHPIQALVRERAFSKTTSVVLGGDARQDSVRNGLAALPPDCDVVVIHDGARCLVDCDTITASIQAAREHGACVVAVPVIDTIKLSNDGCFVDSTLDRRKLYAVQTPQTFRFSVITQAFERAYNDGFVGTDDASFVERLGWPVAIVRGSYENFKITVPSDIVLASALLRGREGCTDMAKTNNTDIDAPAIRRVGHGYDIHRFQEGRRLVLGGVYFPEENGLLGHSDADVLLHAVADAVLGAAGAGDIGKLFPDTDPQYKDADSLELLRHVRAVIDSQGWVVDNVDVTLIAQRPRIAGHTSDMADNIACALGIEPECVNVKATTAEGLGAIGECLGIECHAVAMLSQVSQHRMSTK
jgi:2-C-methyl-D-erythritol 4-phosphate cytidylyltransferase/2-C-methyl-D-erythritol 2,4-cyclodiphosphate synthase